jgi:ornithine decarboxylase
VLRAAAARFVDAFPGRTLYALKCNPHPSVVDAVTAGGVAAFDTASLGEIRQIRESHPDAACYYMNPVKPRAAITAARSVYGVTRFVVDHADELHKLADQLGRDPEVTVAVRMSTDKDDSTAFHLADKFGADAETTASLLRETAALGFRPGLAFHVGSQCLSPRAYTSALRRARDVVTAAGVPLTLLDVGGGFPAPHARAPVPPLAEFMAAIRAGAAEVPLAAEHELVAEPGRALVAEGCAMLLQVHLRKGDRLYLNDGIYGSLSEIQEAGLTVPGEVIRFDRPVSAETACFEVAGPTCDSLDIIPRALVLPDDVGEGDWIAVDCMGAYSNALRTRFNGFGAEIFVDVTDTPERHVPR